MAMLHEVGAMPHSGGSSAYSLGTAVGEVVDLLSETGYNPEEWASDSRGIAVPASDPNAAQLNIRGALDTLIRRYGGARSFRWLGGVGWMRDEEGVVDPPIVSPYGLAESSIAPDVSLVQRLYELYALVNMAELEYRTELGGCPIRNACRRDHAAGMEDGELRTTHLWSEHAAARSLSHIELEFERFREQWLSWWSDRTDLGHANGRGSPTSAITIAVHRVESAPTWYGFIESPRWRAGA